MESGVVVGVASMLFTNKNEGSINKDIKMKKNKAAVTITNLLFINNIIYLFIKLLW